MMEWYQIISYILTNEFRLLLGIYFITCMFKFTLNKKSVIFSLCGSLLVSFLMISGLPSIYYIGAEIIILVAITWSLLYKNIRMCLFFAFFYEIGVALWEFLISAWLGVFFNSDNFINTNTIEYLFAIWIVRIFMIIAAVWIYKIKSKQKKGFVRLFSIFSVLSLLGVISLSEQNKIIFNDNQLTTWTILAIILIFAILIFQLNRQHKMEIEIAKLKQDQAELLARDYNALNQTYIANAKLYHDLHNHIDAIYYSLKHGEINTATEYCEALRTPIRDISENILTGDKTIDYLINSKMSLAKQNDIQTKINIEYPRNTNIQNIDLTTILGNLLDNALEASQKAKGNLRFIHLTIRRINNMLIIKTENGCASAPIIENGNLQTSKSNKAFHGWGLKSIQTAAKRYDGVVNTSYENGVFKSVVTLSYKPIKIT